MNDDVNAQVTGIWTRSTTKILFTYYNYLKREGLGERKEKRRERI